MRELLVRLLRRAPIVKPLWDEYERMADAHSAAIAERDRALADREATLAMHDAAIRDSAVAACIAPPAALAGRRHCWFITERENGSRFWVRADDEYVSRGIIAGTYEPIETAFIRRHVQPGMSVVDIGANLGWFTVNMALLVGAAGHVHAFEPRGDLSFYLRRTVLENRLDNVSIHACALAAQDGEGFVAFTEEDSNHGGTHLLIKAPHLAGHLTQSAPVRRLDSLIQTRVDLIKIDVEGAEKLVFEGARRTIDQWRPIILSEINGECLARTSNISSPDYIGFFEALGYEVRKISLEGECLGRVCEDDLDVPLLSVACLPAERVSDLTAINRVDS